MGNSILIKAKRFCIKLLKTSVATIQKLKAPKTAKDCKSFTRVMSHVAANNPITDLELLGLCVNISLLYLHFVDGYSSI